jgi:hypothetical protein
VVLVSCNSPKCTSLNATIPCRLPVVQHILGQVIQRGKEFTNLRLPEGLDMVTHPDRFLKAWQTQHHHSGHS